MFLQVKPSEPCAQLAMKTCVRVEYTRSNNWNIVSRQWILLADGFIILKLWLFQLIFLRLGWFVSKSRDKIRPFISFHTVVQLLSSTNDHSSNQTDVVTLEQASKY